MTKIKAICFDLDGMYFTPRGKQSFHTALSKEFGADPATVDEVMYRSDAMYNLVTGKIHPSDFWKYLRTETSIVATDEELVVRWIQDYEIDVDVQKVVHSAKDLGYITCVCSNNNAARLPALEAKFGFYNDFNAIVSSHDTGHAKPSKEIFEVLLKKIKVQPNELVYSDDNPERLQGAASLGIRTFVYEEFDGFLENLESLGIDL